MSHTFASMHYGYYGDKQKIIHELDHFNSSKLRHYDNRGAKMKKNQGIFLLHCTPARSEQKGDKFGLNARTLLDSQPSLGLVPVESRLFIA
jgi:hypothetical protein